MLHGAFTPPYCPALPAQMLGSISLCGGARSNCAHPQNMSRGKNILSPLAAFCEEFADGESCAMPKVQINRGNKRIPANFFIPPPKFLFQHSLLLSPRVPPPTISMGSRPSSEERNIVTCCRSQPWRFAIRLRVTRRQLQLREGRPKLPESIFDIRIYSIRRIDFCLRHGARRAVSTI